MKTYKQYSFIADPGHGWLKVSKKELKDLGIENEITGCSYMRGEFAYLEEDCDAGLFIDKLIMKVNKIEKEQITREHYKEFREFVKGQHSNKRSRVREYESYSVLTEEEISQKEEIIEKLLSKVSFSNSSKNKIKNGSLSDLLYWKEYYKVV